MLVTQIKKRVRPILIKLKTQGNLQIKDKKFVKHCQLEEKDFNNSKLKNII